MAFSLDTYYRGSSKILLNSAFKWVFYVFKASDDALTPYRPAIYTHCYDESGTRFFAAGGPLAIERKGHYASIWNWWDRPVSIP